MWTKPEAGSDPSKLLQLLEALEISVSQDDDGRFTVCTTSEPLFCFVRDTEQEINDLVVNTLTSYINTFYDVEDLRITTVSVPVEKPSIPKKELRPVSRIKPTFTSADSQGRQHALA
ncbi:MAG: hypothetical protein F9K38_10035 [Pseudorhodoplanes sp.]|nr:MAG: hypothetical protein F9K38_10035 [Pseudorhodoplanes sp.]